MTNISRRALVLGAAITTLPVPAPGQSTARAWPDPGVPAGSAVLVLGEGDDARGAIERVVGDQNGSYGWYGPTGFERPRDAAGFYPYAVLADLPDGGSGFLPWRALVPVYTAAFLVPGTTTHVAIEYKDNLLSPRLDPYRPKGDGASVHVGGVKAGELQARRDHRWKRVVLTVPPSARPEADGRYRVTIGGGEWGANEIYGSALIHRLIAAPSRIAARRPVAGFWPATIVNLTGNVLLDRAQRPYVPTIVDVGSSGSSNQMDALSLVRANTNLAVGSAEGAGHRQWAANVYDDGNLRQIGVPNNMQETAARGAASVPWVYTDMWLYFIQHIGRDMTWGGAPYESLYDGTWRGVVRVWEAALRDLVATDPNVPLIYLKDEWDHEDPYWGSLEEQVIELRAVANRVAPGVPTWVTAMGWKPLMHRASFDLADIVGSDRYPVQAELAHVAEWAEEMRRAGNGRAFVTVLSMEKGIGGFGADVPPPAEYLRSGFYMGLAHGARGVWIFGEPYRMDDAAGASYYASVGAVYAEIANLQDVIHGSAAELGRTVPTTRLGDNFYPQTYRRSGDGTAVADGIATALRRSSVRTVLIAVNEWTEARRTRFDVSSLAAGAVVQVLFENRSIVASAGGFDDDFAPHQRHVYLVG